MKYLHCRDGHMRNLTDIKLTVARLAARTGVLGWTNSHTAAALIEQAAQLIERAQELVGPEAEEYALARENKERNP